MAKNEVTWSDVVIALLEKAPGLAWGLHNKPTLKRAQTVSDIVLSTERKLLPLSWTIMMANCGGNVKVEGFRPITLVHPSCYGTCNVLCLVPFC